MSFSFWKKKPIQRFLICFIIIFASVETLLYFFPPLFYQEWLAAWTAQQLSLPWNGISIDVNGVAFLVTSFCTGLTTWGLWLGLLWGFAFPKRDDKISYSILGLIGILIINSLRILLIVFVGKQWGVPAADALHTLTWFVLSAIVFGTWYYILSLHARSMNRKKIAALLLSEK